METQPCSLRGRNLSLYITFDLGHAGTVIAQWLRCCATNRKAVGSILMRTSPARIPSEWLIRPQFHLWPAQRHRAVPWIIARYINFRMQHPCTLTKQELMDYMRRARWKTYRRPNRAQLVANFLKILDPPWPAGTKRTRKEPETQRTTNTDHTCYEEEPMAEDNNTKQWQRYRNRPYRRRRTRREQIAPTGNRKSDSSRVEDQSTQQSVDGA